MTTPWLRAAGAASLVVCGLGAGAWVFHARAPRLPLPAVRVPAGEASAPNPSDLAHGLGWVGPDAAASLDEPAPGAQPSSRIPDSLPEFKLANVAGQSTSIRDFAGKSLVINFWATWCAPCQREIPLLQALHSEWAPHGVEVVGIAVDFREKVLNFAERFKIRYPLLVGEQDALDAAAALGVAQPVFPFTVFTDRRSRIVALFVGELHRPQADLILSIVHQLDLNAMQLPVARRAIEAGLAAQLPTAAGADAGNQRPP